MSIFEYFYYLIVAGFLVLILVFISFPDFKTTAAILKTVKIGGNGDATEKK